MTSEQLKWFKEKFNELHYKKQREIRNVATKPAAVRAAERLVTRYNNKVRAADNKRRERLSAAAEVVREAMIFGDDGRIRKAFDTFKSFKP
jgi:hypothetical protein